MIITIVIIVFNITYFTITTRYSKLKSNQELEIVTKSRKAYSDQNSYGLIVSINIQEQFKGERWISKI